MSGWQCPNDNHKTDTHIHTYTHIHRNIIVIGMKYMRCMSRLNWNQTINLYFGSGTIICIYTCTVYSVHIGLCTFNVRRTLNFIATNNSTMMVQQSVSFDDVECISPFELTSKFKFCLFMSFDCFDWHRDLHKYIIFNYLTKTIIPEIPNQNHGRPSKL